jgi:hypothetical protein
VRNLDLTLALSFKERGNNISSPAGEEKGGVIFS